MASECPECTSPLFGPTCDVCGWPHGNTNAARPTEEIQVWDDSLSSEIDWAAREPESQFDIPTGAATDTTTHAGTGLIISGGGGAEPDQPVQGSRLAGFMDRFKPLRITGVVEQVDQPRVESVSMAAHRFAHVATTGCLMAPFRAIGLLSGFLFAPLRFLVPMSIMSTRGPQGPDQIVIPINTFLVAGDDGNAYECVLRGELRGGALRQGDHVDIQGRFDKHGVMDVSSMANLRTGAAVSAFVDPRAKGGHIRAIAATVLLISAIWLVASRLR